jgi:hypothetical protein
MQALKAWRYGESQAEDVRGTGPTREGTTSMASWDVVPLLDECSLACLERNRL